MNQITIEELSAYLPYNVQVKEEYLCVIYNETVIENYTLDIENLGFIFGNKNRKLLLRPLSQLTTEIEVNGEKFVPILELYKLSNEYNYKIDIDYDFVESWGAGKILKVYHNKEKTSYTEFIYNDLKFRKDTRYNKGSFCWGIDLPHNIVAPNEIYNQYELFQKLLSWHFDIFGLLDRKLAEIIEYETKNTKQD